MVSFTVLLLYLPFFVLPVSKSNFPGIRLGLVKVAYMCNQSGAVLHLRFWKTSHLDFWFHHFYVIQKCPHDRL